MKKVQNESPFDRIVRIIFGFGIFILSLSMTGGIRNIVTIIALVLVITGITGFCAIYRIFSISTLKK